MQAFIVSFVARYRIWDEINKNAKKYSYCSYTTDYVKLICSP
jgi:hypothetical protein